MLESREKHGANVLTPPKRDSLWQIFIGNFEDPVIRILMVAVFLSGGIAISMYFSEGIIEIAETIGIAVAILLQPGCHLVCMGCKQEIRRAESSE